MLLLPAGFGGGGTLRANPSDGTVVGGSANISSGPGQVTVTQQSDRAVVNWGSFSIRNGEATTFVQPGSKSAVLNRVTGGSVSQLDGNLNANGQVYLVNKNGVVVGKTGRVNTGSFTASTHDVDSAQFLQGGELNFSGTSTAGVANYGKIKATDGDVTLIARQVENHGKITAKKGSVNLAGGTEVLLKPSGSDGQRVFIKSTSGSGSVLNAGTIKATAAELRAAGGNEYALAVNNTGIIRATTADKSGGRIVLKAERGTAQNSGSLIARSTSPTPGKSGGKVVVTGEKVRLTSTSVIDTSSAHGKGGTANIGGGYQGKDATVSNAKETVVEAGSVINVDGQRDAGPGFGGTAVVWSDERTDFLGSITARDGGFAEVSSHGLLNFHGAVDTAGGTLLLDPASLTISNGLTTNPGSPTTSTIDSVLNVTDLVNLLASGNVTLQAANFIVVSTAVTSASGRNLTFNTAALYLNAPISLGGGTLAGTPSLINVYVNGGSLLQNGVDAVAAGGHVYVAAGTFLQTGQVNIRKALTLSGTGTGTILDGGLNSRLIVVDPGAGAQVNISGLQITQGRDTNGGALYVQSGSLNLSNTMFINNAATSVGGAIVNFSTGSLTLSNVIFQNNSAGTAGGALYDAAGVGPVSISNSTFTTNYTSNFGGAVAHLSSSRLFVADTTFDTNAATDGAGISNSGALSVTGSTFLSNVAGSSGGGIYNDTAATAAIANTAFTNNRAQFGGAIHNNAGTVTIHNGTFTANSTVTTIGKGGAIYNEVDGTLNITGSLFDSNTVTGPVATNGGGGIATLGGTVSITDTTLKNNSGPTLTMGGGIYSTGTVLSLTRTTLDTNQAGIGGGLYLSGGTVTIQNSTLSGNSATSIGGGIYTAGSSLTITGSTLSGNKALAGDGGGMYSAGSTIDVTRSTFYGNNANPTSGFGGGLAIHSGSTLTMSSSTVEENSAFEGGGLDNFNSTSTISGSSFLSNHALNYAGGGIVNYGTMFISNSTLAKNTAPEGGAILNARVLTITSSTIVENEATLTGGGIFNILSLTIGNSILASNTGGSKPDLVNSSVITNAGYNLIGIGDTSAFTGDTTTTINVTSPGLAPLGYYGGPTQTYALLVGSPALGSGNPALSGTTDQRGRSRSANLYSGGVDIGSFQAHSDGGDYVVTNTLDNVTPAAGSLRFGILAAGLAETPNRITFNIAAGGTGYDPIANTWTIANYGEFFIDHAVTIDGSTQPGFVVNSGQPRIILRGDTAKRVFFIAAATGTTITLDSLGITGGNSSGAGGGIWILGGDVHIQNSLVYQNGLSGTSFGGGVYLDIGTSLTVTNSTFSDNRGSGIVNSGGQLIVTGSTFVGNTTFSGYGGAIRNVGGNATIINSTFAENSGGAIVIASGSVNITSSTIGHNLLGDGVKLDGGSLTIQNSIFADSLDSGFLYSDLRTDGGTFTDNGYNIIESSASTIPLTFAPTTKFGDPKLSTLGWYGGPTQTYGLMAGSIALNAIPTGSGTDQRGVVRSGPSDIGAFESRAAYTVTTTVDYDAGTAPRGIDGSLRIGLNIANAGIDEGRNVNFNIASTDRGYNFVTGKWTITEAIRATPDTTGFQILNSVVINGATQPGYGATSGPSIIVNGNHLGTVFTVDSGTGNAVTLNALGITNGTGSDASGSNFGGGIYAASGDLTLSNSRVYNNTTTGDGGGLYIATGANALVTGTTIQSNTSGGSGAGIANNGGLNLTNSTIANNTATGDAGGIYSTGTLLSISGSVISYNTGSQGGGIETINEATIDNTIVSANTAINAGGGVMNYGSGLVTITNSSIVSNTSPNDAGGILSTGGLSLINTIVASNSASRNGGGLDLFNALVTITGSTIVANQSLTSNGGGIYAESSVITLNNSIVAGNTAQSYGGGIYSDGSSSLNITASDISGNSIRFAFGGGIESAGLLTIDGSSIVGNTGSIAGGGIDIAQTTAATPILITNTIINGNYGGAGGGIYSQGGALTLTGSTVSYNFSGNGGGLLLTSAVANTATIRNSTIEGNFSGNAGGGIYVDTNTTLNIDTSLITRNISHTSGGIQALGSLAPQLHC
ncbi:MAG: right-handed parallel beta-helix repeat-containing protein [Candidatus Methylacidiphilales bacterium]